MNLSYEGRVDKWDVDYYRGLLERLREGIDGSPIEFDGYTFFVDNLHIERELTIEAGAEFGDLKFSAELNLVS